jgi:hypothetical protein
MKRGFYSRVIWRIIILGMFFILIRDSAKNISNKVLLRESRNNVWNIILIIFLHSLFVIIPYIIFGIFMYTYYNLYGSMKGNSDVLCYLFFILGLFEETNSLTKLFKLE